MVIKSRRPVFLKILIIALLVSLLSTIGVFSVNGAEYESVKTDNPDLVQGKESFLKARKLYYNAETAIEEVIKLFSSSQDSFAKLPDGYEKYYWKSQVSFSLAEMAENAGDKKQAAQGFNESNKLIRKALDYNAKSSDANRVLADTIMRLMGYNGTMYMITQGPQALKLLNHALSLNQYNYTAMNSLGIYYLNAPVIGGGSVDKAIEILQKALESPDEFDQFIAYVWLGNAYSKKKNQREAVRYFNKALQIYPNNPWAKNSLQKA